MQYIIYDEFYYALLLLLLSLWAFNLGLFIGWVWLLLI